MKKLILLILIACLLAGCFPVGRDADMAYSNITFPVRPTYDTTQYPYYAVLLKYNLGSDDWYAARLAISSTPFYYDTENKYVTSDSECLWTEALFGDTAWADGWGEATQTWIPGLSLAKGIVDGIQTNDAYLRVWTPAAIYDTEGNLHLAANSATPVYVYEGFTISPEKSYVVKGRGTKIQHTLALADGTILDNTHFLWTVTVFQDGTQIDVDWASVDENGLLTITSDSVVGCKVAVAPYDAVKNTDVSITDIRAICLKSFLTGLALGLAGKPLPLVKKEPVAYLYNGVRLPKLPEWDREKYPYAELEVDKYGNHYLIVLTAPSIRDGSSYKYTEDGICNGYQVNDGVWVSYGEITYKIGETHNTDAAFGDRIFWSNYDILYEDGKVHLAASYPIPVYE